MSPKSSSTSSEKAKPPKVPGYVVGKEIGRGAMGIVYRATQEIVDREVALKVLHPEHSNTPRLVSRLQREARTTARLAHPHVVSAIDMGETDGLWWYAMEYVDGKPLSERLTQGGKLTERTALRLLIPLCEALEHLYENGVVHRDIKPGNILISKVGGARLADLGLAFAEDDPSLTGRGGTLGTPHYISPEQAVDSRRADVRSDIWSFGATFFHAVCGQPPFRGKSAAEILSSVLYAPIPEPRELSPELSKGLSLILRKCLTRDPELRYQTPGDLLRDLERVRERRAPKIRQRNLDPVAGEERSRSRLWILAASVVLLSLGAWWGDVFGMRGARAGSGTEELATFEPLEAFAERLPPAPEEVSERLRELEALRELLDPLHVPRWEALNAQLVIWLGERQHSAQMQVGRRIEAALIDQDFSLATRILAEQYPERLVEQAGLNLAQLRAVGLKSESWQEATQERIASAQREQVSLFEDQLADWTTSQRLRVDQLVEAGGWREAALLLDRDLPSVLVELGRPPLKLPAQELERLEQLLQAGLRVSDSLLKDRWRATDKELALRLRERYEQLLEDLEESRSPRPYATRELELAFSEELELLGVDLEQLPSSFIVTCQELFEQRRELLSAREADLLAEDASEEIEATEILCEPLWTARQYERIASLWSEVTQQIDQLAERTREGEDAWRSDLAADCALRRAEALLVEREVLQPAADRIVQLNGLKLDKLTVGGITLSRQKVKSGLFPLQDGFRVVDYAQPIFLQELGYSQVLRLADLEDREALGGERLLALACFLYYEGRQEEAAALLREGLVLQGELARLPADLERRVALASGARQEDYNARLQEARFKLDYVFNSGNQLHMANKVMLYVDSLLNELGDLDEVRSKSRRLREVRDRVRAKPKLAPKDAIRQAYRLDQEHLRFDGSKDVSLDYEFSANQVGTWQKGQWIFDALGWVAAEKSNNWDELIYQNGPRLNLVDPLIVDRFDLSLELEVIDGGQLQLFALGAMGFNLALIGPGLPGEVAGYALTTDSGRFDEFLESLPKAKRQRKAQLLLPKRKHTLRLVGHRSSGSLQVELDGQAIWSGNHAAVRGDTPNIQIASWDRVRLTRALLKATR